MSQPPGQHGGPYGQPGPYGPRGQGQPPRERSVLPWVAAAMVVVLAGVGVLLVVLLRGDGNGGEGTASGSTTSPVSSAPGPGEPPIAMEPSGPVTIPGGAGSAPGGGMRTETPEAPSGGADEGQIPGSADLASQWVAGMAALDPAGVWALTCPALQRAAEEGSTGTDLTPQDHLLGYFTTQTLGGETIADGGVDSVAYDPAADVDVVTFTLQLADGASQSVEVWVDPTLTVCDFS
ncbi:hypothetical protein [Geodermatophilus sabuli]|nr:hypothetical protein [Geodermatophilus sabuli]MBB3082560.1 hypothetical protein [Geodermatophilus sabuli]